MKKLYILLVLCFALTTFAQGQDAHFSQFYQAHQELNPAMNGLFQGQYRFGIQYRDQWSNIVNTHSYKTAYASFDGRIHVKNNDFFTVGADFMKDEAGTGNLVQNLGHFSIGYIKQLTNNKYGVGEQFLIGSFRGGFGQNSIDWSRVWFGRQFDVSSGVVNPDAISGEELLNNSGNTLVYGDFGGGLMWYTIWTERRSLYIGIAVQHLNQPRIGFFRIWK